MEARSARSKKTESEIREWNAGVNESVKKIVPRTGGKIDFWLLLAVLVLTGIGLYMSLTTSYYNNLLDGAASPMKTFYKQVIFTVAGIVVMFAMCFRWDYAVLVKNRLLYKLLWGACVVVLAAVLFLGSEANGAGRWINLGFISIQPSEFVKFAIAVCLAAYLQKHYRPSRKNFWIMLILIAGIPAALIFAQKAMSMTMIVLLMTFTVLLVSGASWVRLSLVVLMGVAAVVVGICLEPFRLERILDYAQGNLEYQALQSVYGFANGGLFGVGMNGSMQKYGFLPEAENDCVFSIFAEERGFFGVVLLIALYIFIIWRGLRIAQNARCRFGAYTAFGIIIMIAMQTVINMAVACALFPVTGQTLPMISVGGSALLANFMAFGLLLNISKDVYC